MEETPAEKRQKNPSKVAAGKKSAENRRKKQEEAEARHEDIASRLARLEEIKQTMHAVPGHAVPANSELAGDDGTSEEAIQPKEPEQLCRNGDITIVTSPCRHKAPLDVRQSHSVASGWPIETIVVGGLGLAVIGYMVYTTHLSKAQLPERRAPNIAGSVPSTEARQPNSSTTELRQRDPLYME